MDKQQDSLWKLAEKIIYNDYLMDNIKLVRIMIANKGNELNISGIEDFLKGHKNKEEAISLIKELHNKGKLLPDYLGLDGKKEIFIIEVKNRNSKVTLSNTEEREAIKIFADKGYLCLIKNLKFPNINNIDLDQLKICQEEYGRIMKGITKGNFLKSLSYFEKRQSNPYKNVYIFNFEVRECV